MKKNSYYIPLLAFIMAVLVARELLISLQDAEAMHDRALQAFEISHAAAQENLTPPLANFDYQPDGLSADKAENF